jgi:hypothetical protein
VFRRKKVQKTYDRILLEPVVRASICTGERAAGFRNCETGRFEEVMLIRTDADLSAFCQTYGITKDDIKTIY